MPSSFDLDQFIADCRSALTEDAPERAARELLARALSDPNAVIDTIGEPTQAGVEPIYKSDTLTLLHVVWGPHMSIMPHDHAMWAVIGVYTGREDTIYWRRLKDDPAGRIEAAGAGTIGETDVLPLGKDAIHSVVNPVPRLTGAIHIYGGDFFGAPRKEWDPDTLEEHPYDVEKNMALFEKANAALRAA